MGDPCVIYSIMLCRPAFTVIQRSTETNLLLTQLWHGFQSEEPGTNISDCNLVSFLIFCHFLGSIAYIITPCFECLISTFSFPCLSSRALALHVLNTHEQRVELLSFIRWPGVPNACVEFTKKKKKSYYSSCL